MLYCFEDVNCIYDHINSSVFRYEEHSITNGKTALSKW
jgi:hypothetical protein